MGKFAQRWFLPLLYLTDNWISRAGLFLLLSATVFWIFLTGASAASGYLGILQFVALPVAFFAGLSLVPIGISMQRRKEAPDHQLHLPEKIELANPRIRRLIIFVGSATFVNLVIGGALTYSTVRYMESPNFCGTACHVMAPEHMAYQVGSHAQVKCVECHIGEGAGNFIRAKLNGTRQLYLILAGSYSRPIPSPPHALKPASETCENCHSRNHDFGNKLWRRTQFADNGDRLETALMLNLGGAEGKGIHGAHMGRGLKIDYEAADAKRDKILGLRVTKGGQVTEFATSDFSSGKVKSSFRRHMDCLDCHNRPAHEFELPDRAVDKAMTEGLLPQTIPFFRKAALEVLGGKYASHAEAEKLLPAQLVGYYQKNQPGVLNTHKAELEKASLFLLTLYQRNVSPEMKVTWGTYPQHLGHTDSPGCFRCHGDELKPKTQGKAITQDCDACHKVIGVEEKDLKALQELGGL